MKKRVLTILNILALLIISIIIVGSFFIKSKFPMVSVDELYFYATNGVTNSDNNVFILAIKTCLPFVVLLTILFSAILYDISFGHFNFICKIKKKNKRKKQIQLYPLQKIYDHRKIATLVLFIISLIIAAYNINGITFIKNSSTKSKFIEINYVDPKNTQIEFKEKRNLILIVVESLETTFFTKNQGGSWDYGVTKELYKLTKEKDSTAFYQNKVGQEMEKVEGATWTTGSVITNTSGIPFKIPIDGNSYRSNNFLNGAYTLGDILKENGYNNELITSARASFGGLDNYFTKHGKYNIIDADNVDKYNLKIGKNDLNDWGFSDRFLFNAAKKRLKTLTEENKPFNLNLITIDTHFTDGNIYDYSINKYDARYENAYATTSKLIYDFVNWIKTQDFYENTAIVIVGDHLSMQHDFFKERNVKKRYIYNCYINSNEKPIKTKNRVYTALDTYPSTISAIGGKIKGERLGLGVNLFSSKKTLPEKYTLKKVNKEILKKSKFYNDKILGKDYKKMKETKE